MRIQSTTLQGQDIPKSLQNLTSPPQSLFVIGTPLHEILAGPSVAIVGSRKVSAYGREVTSRIASDLARLGLTIISGLALGIDSIAHQAALDVNGVTVAVLPSGINRIYPSSHYHLSTEIVKAGGSLVSEYDGDSLPRNDQFIARNRLIAGLADGLLITEAALKSGSLHTARFALEQGKTVMAVPGNITSPTSEGTNNLIKAGAIPISSYEDVLQALNLEVKSLKPKEIIADNEQEFAILNLLKTGVAEGSALQAQSGLEPVAFNQTLTMLEINGRIKSLGADRWSLS